MQDANNIAGEGRSLGPIAVMGLCLTALILGVGGIGYKVMAAPTETPAAQIKFANHQDCNFQAKDCACLMDRAAGHTALPVAGQLAIYKTDAAIDLAELDVTDAALADAYFRGTLDDSLSSLEAFVPAIAGQPRDSAQALLRDMKLRAARTAAGSCIDETHFASVQAFSKTGLGSSVMQGRLSAAYRAAQDTNLRGQRKPMKVAAVPALRR